MWPTRVVIHVLVVSLPCRSCVLPVSLRVFAVCLPCLQHVFCVLSLPSAVTLPYPWLYRPISLLRLQELVSASGRRICCDEARAVDSLCKISHSLTFSQGAPRQTVVALDGAPVAPTIRPFPTRLVAESLRRGPFLLFTLDKSARHTFGNTRDPAKSK